MFLGAGGELNAFKLDAPLSKFNEQPYYKSASDSPLVYSDRNQFNLRFSPELTPTQATLSSFCFFKCRDFSLVTLTKTEPGDNPKTSQVKLILGTLDGDQQYKTLSKQGYILTDIHPLAQAQEVTLSFF